MPVAACSHADLVSVVAGTNASRPLISFSDCPQTRQAAFLLPDRGPAV